MVDSIIERNYLRVRGEYGKIGGKWCMNTELPPRARRIRRSVPAPTKSPGTTSACAENTLRPKPISHFSWNYLRVRGEYNDRWSIQYSPVELPPRARRIAAEKAVQAAREGTTSACAENTHGRRAAPPGGWNYLRVRGEYHTKHLGFSQYKELPPRARRIRSAGSALLRSGGTTSAHAENTCEYHPTGQPQ